MNAAQMQAADNSTISPNQREKLYRLLKNLRVEARLNQDELAHRLNKPQSFVSKYESGERRLDILEITCVCAAVGVSLSEFAERLERQLRGSNTL